MSGKFHILYDAGHGSSAKAAAACRLAEIYKIQNASTCNFPNAGHTYVHGQRRFVSKCLPSPAALAADGKGRPNLWVGPNSGFFEEQLKKELAETGYTADGIFVHNRAAVVEQRHADMEAGGGKTSTEHIASTMSGSGAAYAEKAMRQESVKLARDLDWLHTNSPSDFVSLMRYHMQDLGEDFIHEVSQGYALSVDYGTHFPMCTFRNPTPQQAYADMMLTPQYLGEVYMNVRTFPIRVGNVYSDDGSVKGYSGDFAPDQVETTWEQIAQDAEMPTEVAKKLSEAERTTVTRRVRRVATQSWDLLAESARNCGATKMILNFPQYLHWSAYAVRGGEKEFKLLHPKVREYVDRMEEVTNLKVIMIGTSAEHDDYIWRG